MKQNNGKRVYGQESKIREGAVITVPVFGRAGILQMWKEEMGWRAASMNLRK